MSNMPRRRRLKRPVLLVKHSQLNKKNHLNIRSYKTLYEKLKANNIGLAKALATERQETQYLFVQNNALTSEVQELRVACNRRDDVISGLLKNAKETLQCILSMTPYVTNTIATCQQGLPSSRLNPRKSTSTNRRDSTRRLSGKSPARGVVQPMVSGHTITKPTINLSRLNLQRVRVAPNLSDIDESLTPEQSPPLAASTSSVTSRIPRSLHYGTRSPVLNPECVQDTIRTSDANERRSSARRNSSRYTCRRTRGPSESPITRPSNQTLSTTPTNECLKNPRIALHDVSRLLQNAQSVNIRTLLETSDVDLSRSHNQTEPESSLVKIAEERSKRVLTGEAEDSEDETKDSSNETKDSSNETKDSSNETKDSSNETKDSSNETKDSANEAKDSEDESKDLSIESQKSRRTSNGFSKRVSVVGRKSNNRSLLSDTEDPLEGPSWLLNGTEGNNVSTENEVSTTVDNFALKSSVKDCVKGGKSDSSSDDEIVNVKQNERKRNSRLLESQISLYSSPKLRKRRLSNAANNERAENRNRWSNQSTGLYKYLDDDDQTERLNLARFVTRKRGSGQDDYNDDEYYTLLFKNNRKRKEYRFDMEDLQLPVFESPIAVPVEPRTMEPEQTTNIQRITQTFGNYAGPTCPYPEDTIFEHTGLVLPVIPENLDSTQAVVEQDEQSSEEEIILRPKKNPRKKTLFDSQSESDWTPTPEKKKSHYKRNGNKAKDPSAAKVVLQKLSNVDKRTLSIGTRESYSTEQGGNSLTPVQRDESSDTEGSIASYKTRPRRKKAPTNLQEPSLGKKLRRN